MQKRLKPSLREKKRYILVNSIDKSLIEQAILEFLGVLGYSKAGVKFIKRENQTAVAVNREEVDKVRAALSFKDIPVTRVSGTIKGLRK